VTVVRIDRNQRVRAAIDAGLSVARGAHAIDHAGHLEVVVIDGGVDEDRAGGDQREHPWGDRRAWGPAPCHTVRRGAVARAS
jgi:hypothetical protein